MVCVANLLIHSATDNLITSQLENAFPLTTYPQQHWDRKMVTPTRVRNTDGARSGIKGTVQYVIMFYVGLRFIVGLAFLAFSPPSAHSAHCMRHQCQHHQHQNGGARDRPNGGEKEASGQSDGEWMGEKLSTAGKIGRTNKP